MALLLASTPSRNKEIYGSSRIKEVHKVSSGKIWYKIVQSFHWPTQISCLMIEHII